MIFQENQKNPQRKRSWLVWKKRKVNFGLSTFNRFFTLVSLLSFKKVDSYEDKIESLVDEVAEHKEEIAKLRSTIQGMTK